MMLLLTQHLHRHTSAASHFHVIPGVHADLVESRVPHISHTFLLALCHVLQTISTPRSCAAWTEAPLLMAPAGSGVW